MWFFRIRPFKVTSRHMSPHFQGARCVPNVTYASAYHTSTPNALSNLPPWNNWSTTDYSSDMWHSHERNTTDYLLAGTKYNTEINVAFLCHLWETVHSHWAIPVTVTHDDTAYGATRIISRASVNLLRDVQEWWREWRNGLENISRLFNLSVSHTSVPKPTAITMLNPYPLVFRILNGINWTFQVKKKRQRTCCVVLWRVPVTIVATAVQQYVPFVLLLTYM
jgi:hypothetical protein